MSGSDSSEAGSFAVGLAIGVAVTGVCLLWASSSAKEDWKREAVKRGAAEYITTEQGTPEWRWKNERK